MTIYNSYASVKGGVNNKAIVNVINDYGFQIKTFTSKSMETAMIQANKFINKFQNIKVIKSVKPTPIKIKSEIMNNENKVEGTQYFITPPVKGNIVKVYLGKDGNKGHYYGTVTGSVIKNNTECVLIGKIDTTPILTEIDYFLDEDRVIINSGKI